MTTLQFILLLIVPMWASGVLCALGIFAFSRHHVPLLKGIAICGFSWFCVGATLIDAIENQR